LQTLEFSRDPHDNWPSSNDLPTVYSDLVPKPLVVLGASRETGLYEGCDRVRIGSVSPIAYASQSGYIEKADLSIHCFIGSLDLIFAVPFLLKSCCGTSWQIAFRRLTNLGKSTRETYLKRTGFIYAAPGRRGLDGFKLITSLAFFNCYF